MPRKLLRRWLPSPQRFHREQSLRFFGGLLKNRNLWHLNRNSVATAVGVGLFMAFMPLPSQMIIAAGLAILLGCNLPIAVALCWITNPLTIPIFFYGAYKVGAWVLGMPIAAYEFEFSFTWLKSVFADVWLPLLVGCLVLGTLSGLAGNLLTRALWRFQVVSMWRRRQQLRRDRKTDRNADKAHQANEP
ncbi:MAG: DUF2062 domain-containing protein [Pseudomonadota bacterium]